MKIVKRKQAIIGGSSRYFTGKPCGRGHLAERYTSNGGCVVCVDAAKAKDREWAKRQKNPERELMVLDWREGKRSITREDAQRVGLDWYCEGKVLSCGHGSPQWLDGSCKMCDEQQLLEAQQLLA